MYNGAPFLRGKAMKTVKTTAEYTVYKRADGRHAVKGKDKKFINGDDKVNILIAEGLLTAPQPKPAEPEATDKETAEATEDAAEE
jgi:hypothetical protein